MAIVNNYHSFSVFREFFPIKIGYQADLVNRALQSFLRGKRLPALLSYTALEYQFRRSIR